MLVMPNKYVSISESYLGIGGVLLTLLSQEKRIEDLWFDYKKNCKEKNYKSQNFESFQQSLNLLFALGLIIYKNSGVISKCD